MTPFVVVLDGIDGCGKTTVSKMLAETLQCPCMRDPGTSKTAEAIREIIMNPEYPMDGPVQTLLFTACRRLLADEIRAVDAPFVVLDRWLSSTYVYQSLQGVSTSSIMQLHKDWVGLTASKVFILDVHIDTALRRTKRGADRFDHSGLQKYCDRANAYLRFAEMFGWHVISGDQTPQQVHDEILSYLPYTKGKA